jgi:signal transduction histidine kinase
MTLTEEKERKQFADYLHDQIGQELFAIKIKLERLKDSLSSNEDVKIQSDLSNSLIGIINNTRSLTFELSPPILYQLGLEAALEWLAEHTYEQYNIVVSFEDDKQEKPLDEDVKIFLYRAVRELLTNVAKHAQTQNAKVSIEKDIAHIKICVEDNGVGFTPSSKHSSKEKGFGLFSIKERLDYLGGELEIGSQPGRGTRATLIAPLKGQ